MNLKERYKSLPIDARRMMSLGAILALVVALPLFVWAIINLNFNQNKRAATAEPRVTVPINWTTPDVTITADDFYIVSNGKTYYGDDQNVTIIPGVVDTNPGAVHWANIEVRSNQYGDDLRMKIYFRAEGSTWNVSSVGILNSNYSSQWVSYNNPLIYTVLGHSYHQNGNTYFTINDPNTGQKVVDVYFTNLRVQAFTPLTATASPTASPTAYPNPQCNDTCLVNTDCSSGYICFIGAENSFVGNCRKPSCAANSNCDCGATASPTVTASPTATATATATATSTSAPIAGDANDDGVVNIVDLGIIVDHYGESSINFPGADVNGDGTINVVDISIVIENY